MTERFTRADAHTVDYQVTIEDPNTWTKPWTMSYPLRQEPGYTAISEYACHEGNIFMHDVLSGARAVEAKSAAAEKGSK